VTTAVNVSIDVRLGEDYAFTAGLTNYESSPGFSSARIPVSTSPFTRLNGTRVETEVERGKLLAGLDQAGRFAYYPHAIQFRSEDLSFAAELMAARAAARKSAGRDRIACL